MGGRDLTYISIVPRNRELLVIADMEVFANFFCYAKKQKKGVVNASHAVHTLEELDDIDAIIE